MFTCIVLHAKDTYENLLVQIYIDSGVGGGGHTMEYLQGFKQN